MRIERLRTVDAFIAFDLDDAPVNAGGTRFAPDVTEEEAGVLARSMTYKFGVLGREVGGAKGAVRGDRSERAELMRRFCEEVRPLVASARFLTGPDLGTSEADFAPLRDPGRPPHIMSQTIAGVPFEDLVAGFGVVAAAEAAMGSLEGATIALEGFGKVGGGVAREAVRRGARMVAVSTLEGCVRDPAGIDVELLIQLRKAHGDACVWHVGREVDPPECLFEADAEVLVPGARTGVITSAVAQRLRTRWVVPAANAPYAAGVPELLHARGIRALPDFVCNCGAVIGYTSDPGAGPGELFREVESRIAALVAEASTDPGGYFAGGCRIAERFIESWRGPDGVPSGGPVA
jgi:glutamate dehydrogenase/leucine dehydrogenase